MTNCEYGCPIGNLALELANSHPQAAKLLAENFTGWRKVIEQCLAEAAGRLPADLNRDQLATHILVTMEGAVMLARTYKDMGPYDSAVTQLARSFRSSLRRRHPVAAATPGPHQIKTQLEAKVTGASHAL